MRWFRSKICPFLKNLNPPACAYPQSECKLYTTPRDTISYERKYLTICNKKGLKCWSVSETKYVLFLWISTHLLLLTLRVRVQYTQLLEIQFLMKEDIWPFVIRRDWNVEVFQKQNMTSFLQIPPHLLLITPRVSAHYIQHLDIQFLIKRDIWPFVLISGTTASTSRHLTIYNNNNNKWGWKWLT